MSEFLNSLLGWTSWAPPTAPEMTGDLWALVATIALAVIQLSLSSILSLAQLGPGYVAGPRDQWREATGLTGRVVRAHRNLLEIFPQFAAALFIVHAADAHGQLAVIGAWMFVAGRALYAPAYVFAPPGLRSVFWQVGQIGVIVVLADLFV